MSCCHLSCFFFFFQAEKGIRVRTVTGVKRGALPVLGGGGGGGVFFCFVSGFFRPESKDMEEEVW